MDLTDRAGAGRGRPRGSGPSPVHNALLKAFQDCLLEKSPAEVTLKDIADRAGASAEMIRYYFGGKDGLATALLKESTARFSIALAELERDILSRGGNPTEHLVRVLHGLYMSARVSMRLSTAEFMKQNSVIKNDFLKDRAETVVQGIERVLARLVRAGIYDEAIDPKFYAVIVMTMVSGPIALTASLPANWVSMEKITDRSWVDQLTQAIDRMCRSDRSVRPR